ncbi:hypothetical protein SAMN05216330_13013 [Bradyrhizobium sp. Ghvi]|nr:hypothetical protein SAMN05216330_13013 [Bradyrhizobium sp. Ghvi]
MLRYCAAQVLAVAAPARRSNCYELRTALQGLSAPTWLLGRSRASCAKCRLLAGTSFSKETAAMFAFDSATSLPPCALAAISVPTRAHSLHSLNTLAKSSRPTPHCKCIKPDSACTPSDQTAKRQPPLRMGVGILNCGDWSKGATYVSFAPLTARHRFGPSGACMNDPGRGHLPSSLGQLCAKGSPQRGRTRPYSRMWTHARPFGGACCRAAIRMEGSVNQGERVSLGS